MLLALSPTYGVIFLIHHGIIGFLTLGAVFLAVTGAEALYADLGHFGRRPIQVAWLGLVLPSLVLNYFGQGALVLRQPETLENPFFLMAPGLGAAADGGPRHGSPPSSPARRSSPAPIRSAGKRSSSACCRDSKSATRRRPRPGQIYMPRVNLLLLLGVLLLVVGIFRSSERPRGAYGIAVTGDDGRDRVAGLRRRLAGLELGMARCRRSSGAASCDRSHFPLANLLKVSRRRLVSASPRRHPGRW